MINFDQVGLKNNSDKVLASAARAETDNIANMGEVLSAKLKFILNEELGISKFVSETAGRRDQFKKLYDVTGDEKWNVSWMSENYSNVTYDSELDLTPIKTRKNQDTYEAAVDDIKALQKEYPEAGILTPDELAFSIAERARLNREEVSRLVARSSSNVDLVSNIVSMGAYFLDPVVLATLPITGGASVGRGVVGNAWRSFKIEAAVAGAAEVAITPQVADWKKEINSPFTLQDAAFRIIGASAGAGVIRGTGSVVLDSTQLFRASRLLKKQGKAEDAAVVENYAKVVDGVEPEAHNAHIQAYQAARQALEEGRVLDNAEIERIYAAHDVAVPEVVRTYHGSGAKFEKFENEFMSSGSGGQAFGYGHYVAQFKKEAEFYVPSKSKNRNDVLRGKDIERTDLDTSGDYLYEIDIPESSIEKMIDLDIGIAGQKPFVKDVLEDVRQEMELEQWIGNGQDIYKKISQNIQKIRDGVNNKNADRLTSEYLLSKGIKGNKHIDGPSKKLEDGGSRNFVLFDPEDAIIVTRNDEILKQTQPRNVELRLDKAEQDDLAKSQIQDVQEMIDADDGLFMEVPTFKTDDVTGELEVSTRPAKEVFEEIDNQDKAMDDIFSCVMGAAA
jgi:hypothetical protein